MFTVKVLFLIHKVHKERCISHVAFCNAPFLWNNTQTAVTNMTIRHILAKEKEYFRENLFKSPLAWGYTRGHSKLQLCYERTLDIIVSCPTSASGIIVLLKTPQNRGKLDWNGNKIAPKNSHVMLTIFHISYCICRAWYNGSYAMATKPIKFLELH